MLTTLGYAIEIRLEQMYLQEVLDHQEKIIQSKRMLLGIIYDQILQYRNSVTKNKIATPI